MINPTVIRASGVRIKKNIISDSTSVRPLAFRVFPAVDLNASSRIELQNLRNQIFMLGLSKNWGKCFFFRNSISLYFIEPEINNE